jgi:ABC-type antimicrobial peptide transport system permease subunit
MSELASLVRQVDPSVPMGQMRSMNAQMNESLLRERMLAWLSSAFSGLAGIVAGLGIYGMLTYLVTRRSREIAVRIAVGARPSQVRWLALRESLLLIIAGTILGIPLSLVLSSTVRSQLYGVQSSDPKSMAIAVAFILILAAIASWVPTSRASRVDSVTALKVE